ncbi:MAG: hypothetical protein ACOYL5_16575 [Phototrophicaceae bacterium]
MPLLVLLMTGGFAQPADVWQAFTQQDRTNGGQTVVFVSAVTGESVQVQANGRNYLAAGDSLIYLDLATNVVMQLRPPEFVAQPHPFIQPSGNTRRIDWVVSPDNSKIAWTLVEPTPDGLLTTQTTVASLDGTNPIVALADVPRDGIRAQPISFSADNTTLYMDFQPNGLNELTPYTEYAGLFSIDLNAPTAVTMLPGEPGCFCGAGVGAGFLLRLTLTDSLNGFDLKLIELASATETLIPAVPLRNYTQAGEILVAPDGKRAIYPLAQVTDFGAPTQTVRTVYVDIDLVNRTQRALTAPLLTFARPIAWTENHSAVLLVSVTTDETFKLWLDNGQVERVANAVYVGQIISREP